MSRAIVQTCLLSTQERNVVAHEHRLPATVSRRCSDALRSISRYAPLVHTQAGGDRGAACSVERQSEDHRGRGGVHGQGLALDPAHPSVEKLSDLVRTLSGDHDEMSRTTLEALREFARGDKDLDLEALREVSSLVTRFSVHHMISATPGEAGLG